MNAIPQWPANTQVRQIIVAYTSNISSDPWSGVEYLKAIREQLAKQGVALISFPSQDKSRIETFDVYHDAPEPEIAYIPETIYDRDDELTDEAVGLGDVQPTPEQAKQVFPGIEVVYDES